MKSGSTSTCSPLSSYKVLCVQNQRKTPANSYGRLNGLSSTIFYEMFLSRLTSHSGPVLLRNASATPWRNVHRWPRLAHVLYQQNQPCRTLRTSIPRLVQQEERPEPTKLPDKPPAKPKLTETLRENIYTIPNLLTVSRILACPVLGYAIVQDNFVLASSLLVYAGLTDLVRVFCILLRVEVMVVLRDVLAHDYEGRRMDGASIQHAIRVGHHTGPRS